MQVIDLFTSYYLINSDDLTTPFNLKRGKIIIKYGKINDLKDDYYLLGYILCKLTFSRLFYNYETDKYELSNASQSFLSLKLNFENYILVKSYN